MPTFACKLTEETTALPHVWEHTVGCGHASLLLRADLQRHLRQCHRDLGFGHVRFHGLLSRPMDAAICQDHALRYSFFNADQIIDYLLEIGMKPFIELSFMPEALASGDTTVFHYRANVTPPKQQHDWETLIRRLVTHWLERYGRQELQTWLFEVWNEPNLTAFGTGKTTDYFTLYASTARAIKEVEPSLRVGGPATAASAWIADFVEFVGSHGLPADFISTHQYPTDAFGKPGDDTRTQLAKSRRGVMREKAQGAKRDAGGRPLYYTEWNTSSNPRDRLHDEPFAAAFATNIVMSIADVVNGYSWWTCSDIFNENYMPSEPFQGGFGLLSLHGIAKPVYRAFQLLHRLGTRRLVVDGLHDTVSAWAVPADNRATLLLTNHALPGHQIRAEHVGVLLADSPAPASVRIERIDDDHANAMRTWNAMGAPNYLSAVQVEELHGASELVVEAVPFDYAEGVATFAVDLMPHAVAAVTIEFPVSVTSCGASPTPT
jgi:xylan 1,4-beta-xylosidase